MKEQIKEGVYDIRLYPSDFRYSASIVGLCLYFEYHNISYNKEEDYIEYKQSDITEDKYFEFVKFFYKERLHYLNLLDLLKQEDFTEKEVNDINKLMKANTILKKVFSTVTFEKNNKNEIIELIEKNEDIILRNSFYNGKHMYKKYMDSGIFLEEDDCKNPCKLQGFYVDKSRKKNSICWNFDNKTSNFHNIIEFEFIPFSFTKSYDDIFINNNYSIDSLLTTYKKLNEINPFEEVKENSLKKLIEIFSKISTNYFQYQVEIIKKSLEVDYYETLFLSSKTIELLKDCKNLDCLYNFCYTKNGYDYNFFYIFNCVLNSVQLDNLIVWILKDSKYISKIQLKALIEINQKLNKGVEKMTEKQKQVYGCAKAISKKLEKNKIISYRQKLTSAMSINNTEKIYSILTHLSNFTEEKIPFIYDLLEDFDSNRNLVYTFIMSLEKSNKNEDRKEFE